MKNSIAIAGALVLLLLITMRIGVQGSPIAGIYGEDEGIPLTLLRQRRQAGSCRTNSDCNEWNPCCSKYGYCGTKNSGHCDRGTGDDACPPCKEGGGSCCVWFGRPSNLSGGTAGGVNIAPGFGGR